ncbi:MAG: YbbC/YhhH family protein [Phycisphaerae bacterium]|jgi:hypothetical protein
MRDIAKIMKITGIAVLVLAIAAIVIAEGKHNYKPKEGYVPDEKTAIRIAVAVWMPIYGEKEIEEEKPYRARLDKGVWTVEGSLPKGYDKGGVAEAEIGKDDGCILRVSHGK